MRLLLTEQRRWSAHEQRTIVVTVSLVIVVLYVASYFYLVRPQGVVLTTGRYDVVPGYGGGPVELFIPVHWLDRAVLRPSLWSGVGTEQDVERTWGWR